MSIGRNRQALERSAAAWTAGSLDRYLEIYSPDLVHHGIAPEPVDLQGTRAAYELVWDAFPGSSLEVEITVAEGEMLASRFRLHGVHRGRFMGIAPTGRSIELTGQNILRFENGKNVERWTTSDLFGLLRQLGVRPAPG